MNSDLFKIVVNEEYKFVYLPIPKVASSSIKMALLPLFGKEEEYKRFCKHRAYMQGKKNWNARWRKGMGIHKFYFSLRAFQTDITVGKIQDLRKNGFVVFAAVRNPWDRAVSCYENKVNTKKKVHIPGIKRTAPFEDFVNMIYTTPDKKANINIHWLPQYRFVSAYGELLLDEIIRFESLNADIGNLMGKLGCPELDLPHILRSKREPDYRKYYNDETKALIAERFARDIELFDYEF
tara:strand:+ start:178 stop:888 length:711 start_codon:yes stop_codon:yes gene_type:complete